MLKESNSDNFHFFFQGVSKKNKELKGSVYRYIDVGIAMCHFELTNIENKIKGHWKKLDLDMEKYPNDFVYIASWID